MAPSSSPNDSESRFERYVEALGAALGHTDRIERQTEALSQAFGRFGEAVHRSADAQQAGTSAADGTASTGPGNDNIVDADFEEVDEQKRKRG